MENEFKCATWRYGPNGEAQVFSDSRAVPEGWLDHPAKFINPHFPHDAPLPAQEEQPQDGAEVPQKQPAQDEPPRDADGLRTDGPTLAEFVAAGYRAENYPPEGYASKEPEFQPIPLTRAEVMAQLKERNVSFLVTAKTAVLYTLLLTTLERENDATDETE